MGVQTEQVSTHYSSSLEYFNDQQMILDLLIEEVIQKAKQDATSSTVVSNKLALSDEEALSLLRERPTYLTLSEPYQKLIDRLELIIAEKLDSTMKTVPIHRFLDVYRLDELDKRVLIVMLAPHIDKKYLRLYGYIQDDMSKQFVTLELLIKLCARSFNDIHLLYDRYSKLEQHYRLLYKLGNTEQVLFHESSILIRPIQPNELLVSFLLTGKHDQTMSSLFYQFYHLDFLQANNEPLLIQKELTMKMVQFVNENAPNQPIFQLIGTKGAGKTLQTKHLAVHLKYSLIEVDFSYLASERELFHEQIDNIRLLAKLTHSIVAVTKIDIESENDTEVKKLEWLALKAGDIESILFIHTKSNKLVKLATERPFISNTIVLPLPKESGPIWQLHGAEFCKLDDTEAASIANKFQFTCGQIKQTMLNVKQKLLWKSLADEHELKEYKMKYIIECAYATIHHDLHKKTIKLDSTWEWEDLILPEDTINLLQQACDRIENRQVVMDNWGFSRILPYGRGISMLFTGPPGTGKSMSASVMAKQMKSELYRVDLSTVVSKYIGETEKNLAEIFDQAKQSSAILFFDEADSLFGKRSEVKDSHDKYANMETSFLLQKMEEYEGITILATNFAQNLDEAFNRRIQYIVKFPFPDAPQRERLWRSIIPAKLPTGDIDFAFLAKTFELTGGPIKNIVLTAAYLAANKNEPVAMQHLIEAAIQEYKKSGKLLIKDKLGEYSHFWKG